MKAGKVTIIGKPNVGKSTLLNQIFKKEVVISSRKPQTTKNKISLIYEDDNSQILFTDTPGYHKPKNKLDLFLNSEVKKAIKHVDVLLYLFDFSREFDDEDIMLLNQIKTFDFNHFILVINKVDENVDESKINEIKKIFNDNEYKYDECIFISALNNINVDKLLDLIKSKFDDFDYPIFDKNLYQLKDEFIISEIVRKVIINKFRQEIPYSVAVVVDKLEYKQDKNLLVINYSIVVEKDSQKAIIIGKNGSSIKDIGILVRKELSNIYDCKIYLESFVKVRKNWRDDDLMIKEVGYKK